MRVFAVSDCHTDYKDNKDWVLELSKSQAYKQDALICAGDVSDDVETLERSLQLLASTFAHVVFVPGNHDLWVRRQQRDMYDSIEKLAVVEALCAKLGVHTRPVQLKGVWLAPLLSWYHASWDREPDVPGALPISKVMLDFHACKWTSVPGLSTADDSIAAHFDALNDPAFEEMLESIEAEEQATGVRPPVFSCSHFLPYQELLPEKRMLYYPNLSKACGSNFLAERVQRLRPLAHVFGHTHFSWDASINGSRFIQWPLGYPHEQRQRRNGGAGWLPLQLYDTASGQLVPRKDCYWSSHYQSFKRDPQNVSAAPWANTR